MIQKLTAIFLAVLIVNPICCCASGETEGTPKSCCAQKDAGDQESPDLPSPAPNDSACDCGVKGAKCYLEIKITLPDNAWVQGEPCPCGEFVYTLPSWDHAWETQAPPGTILLDPPRYQVHCVYRL